MAQLISVRSNQDFSLDFNSNKLIPQTEIIILVEKPKYKSKGDKIQRYTEVEEIRFKAGTQGILALIGMLEQAHKVAAEYEKFAGSFNDVFSNLNKEGEIK